MESMLDTRLQIVYNNAKYALHYILEETHEENWTVCFSDALN